MPFWPAPARQHLRLRRSAILARDSAANLVDQPAIRSFAPARTPKLRPKTTESTGSDLLHQHSRPRQIPIAPAAQSVPNTPRFRALALFGRRLSERGEGLGIPASENLHMCGRLRVGKSFLHVWRLGRSSHVFGLLSAVHVSAGHNALRGSGPGQKLAFDNAVARVGCPDHRIDRFCITCCSPSQPLHHAGSPV